jgi:predicted nucleic acid-binding protein
VPPARVATAIGQLLDHDSLSLQDPEVVATAVDGFERRPAVGLADHLILALARRHQQLPLASSDRQFARLEGVRRV